MSDPVELGDLSDLRNGGTQVFPDLGPHGVLVCRVAGTLHAVENNCTHRDTPLSEGRLRGVLITCPQHGAQFDVRDGAPQGPPAFTSIACYAIVETDGIASVQIGD